MRRVRVIPTLLIQDGGLVKSIKFKNHTYVGDPINAVKIFNEKEVDEIIILDISATKQNRVPNIKQIAEIAGEAFMPLAYGGGISNIEQVKEILFQGVEKVVFNNAALNNQKLIAETAHQFGSSSTVVSIDAKKNIWGKYKVYSDCGQKNTGIDVIEFAKQMESIGAGELFINAIEKDGTFSGFDIDLITSVADAVSIPIIACGGARNEDDFLEAINKGKASAVAAGSMFVFNGKHRAVLISYIDIEQFWKKL